MGYVDLKYTPSVDDVVCKFYVEPAIKDKMYVLEQLPAESSIGTWTDVWTMKPRIARNLGAKLFKIKNNYVWIAYPYDAFEARNVSQILSSIAGNIFGVKIIKNLRLIDFTIPRKMLKHYKGPAFGIEGIRKLLKVRERPLIGTIVKPKMGLYPKEHAKVAYEAWVGGVDIVKDDENLCDQKFCRFEERVRETLKLRDKAEKETGERKMYMANITAPTVQEMFKRLKFVKDHGGEYIMIDVCIVGYTTLQTLREAEPGVVLHAHRAMHAAFTRNPKHGIAMQVISKVNRLIGLDQLHIGTIIGKMHGERAEVLACRDIIVNKIVNESEYTVYQDWCYIKPTFPVASGGLNPIHVPILLRYFKSYDLIMQFGGGIHGHPLKTRAGAKAVRDAVDASLKNVPLEGYSKELDLAIEKWGKKSELEKKYRGVE